MLEYIRRRKSGERRNPQAIAFDHTDAVRYQPAAAAEVKWRKKFGQMWIGLWHHQIFEPAAIGAGARIGDNRKADIWENMIQVGREQVFKTASSVKQPFLPGAYEFFDLAGIQFSGRKMDMGMNLDGLEKRSNFFFADVQPGGKVHAESIAGLVRLFNILKEICSESRSQAPIAPQPSPVACNFVRRKTDT
jgi:hypothetical protein